MHAGQWAGLNASALNEHTDPVLQQWLSLTHHQRRTRRAASAADAAAADNGSVLS